MPIDKNHNISDFYDNDIEADEIRTIKTAIEQAADTIEEIGKRDGNG